MSSELRIRSVRPGDERVLFELIRGLATYEKLEVNGSAEQLKEHLFGAQPACEALLAEDPTSGEAIGYALFFGSYSTFRTRPGLYLEDLFVREEARGRGVGGALLRAVAERAVARGAARLEWSVLDWNTPAIGFYEGIGARKLDGWSMFRLAGDALDAFAGGKR